MREALLTGLLALACWPGTSLSATPESAAPPPSWVVDPAAPGDDLPPVGRSLFDQLFAVTRHGQSSIEPPFPFARLLARLDDQLARDPDSPLPPAKRVLIPLGRSLQRTAAAPDYFAFPRVVVAVDSQPTSPAAPYLKDRIYLGYQEKSAVLEVISYNEAAGRFEFQLVKDYRAGGKPQVYYANRKLCAACHQNGSPIFSRGQWDETNANPRLAEQLAASGRRFYGIPPARGIDIPYAIDNASKRANGFALTQRLWREGCGAADPAARRCRAALFGAALRYALSGGQNWTPDRTFRQDVTDRLLPEARRRWPGGLAVGNPELPNRNPLPGPDKWPDDRASRVALSHVAARFEPLAPRPPREIWQATAPDALGKLVAGLAEFVSASDRQRLEAALARQTATPRRTTIPCRFAGNPAASRWTMQCAPAAGQTGPTLAGDLDIGAGQARGGRLSRFSRPGGTALSNIALSRSGPAGAEVFSFTPRLDGRLPRTAEAHILTRLSLRRSASDPTSGEMTLDIRDEFAAVEHAISTLVEAPESEFLFGPGPIPREALLAAVFSLLKAPSALPFHGPAMNLPAPRLEVPAAIPASAAPVDASLQVFFPYCASCHQTAEAFPPNFLTGSGAQVARHLRQCAPRLYVRLAMADLPGERRDKTPMPPETLLPALASDVAGWKNSPSRAAMLAQLSDWLSSESGQPPNLARLLAGGYEALRPCLSGPDTHLPREAP